MSGSFFVFSLGFHKPQKKQVFPLLLRLRPPQCFLRFFARRGLRKSRAEHGSLVRIPAKRKAYHGLNARADVATRALEEERKRAHAEPSIFEDVETLHHGGKDLKLVVTRSHPAKPAMVI